MEDTDYSVAGSPLKTLIRGEEIIPSHYDMISILCRRLTVQWPCQSPWIWLTFENIEWVRKNAFMNIDWSCQDRHNEGTDQNSIVQIKIWSALHANSIILQMILCRIVIYSSLVEQRGRGKMCVWHFRHGMEGYLLYRNAISSLFAWFYAEDRLQLPSWPLNLAHLWEEQVGRTILWPLGISFTSEVRNVLFCLSYDQSQIVTLTALIRNI